MAYDVEEDPEPFDPTESSSLLDARSFHHCHLLRGSIITASLFLIGAVVMTILSGLPLSTGYLAPLFSMLASVFVLVAFALLFLAGCFNLWGVYWLRWQLPEL